MQNRVYLESGRAIAVQSRLPKFLAVVLDLIYIQIPVGLCAAAPRIVDEIYFYRVEAAAEIALKGECLAVAAAVRSRNRLFEATSVSYWCELLSASITV